MGSVLSRYSSELREIPWEERVNYLWNDFRNLLFGEEPFLTDELLEVLFEDDGISNYQIEKTWGVVTKLNENHSIAVINHDIYMDLSVSIPGGKTLRLGDYAFCTIKRRKEEDAWRVEKIEFIERKKAWKGSLEDEFCSWDMDLPNQACNVVEADTDIGDFKGMKPKTIVAQVTKTGDELSLDNGKLKIPASACKGVSYVPGDWLNIKVLVDPEEPDEKPRVLNMAPLRKWQSEGRFTVIEGNTGVIDNDIYFHDSICSNSYHPKLKDWVHFVAIESQHGGSGFSWRAISVVPSMNALCKGAANYSSFSPTARPNMRDISGITLDREIDFGVLDFNAEKEIKIKVRNQDSNEHLLKDVRFINTRNNFELRNTSLPIILPSGREILVEVYLKASSMGKIEDIMEFDFGAFLIERAISAEVGQKEPLTGGNRFLDRFTKLKQVSRRQVMEDEFSRESTWTTKGVRPYKPPPFTTMRLEQFPVPRSLWHTIQQKLDVVGCNPVLAQILCPETYCKKFQILLHLEEIETTVRLRMYDIPRASLKPVGPYLSLEVSGLTEKRPSLVPGDGVILSNPWGGGGLNHEGFVHATLRTEALLQFHPDFHAKYDNKDYAVRFVFNRTPLRRHHTAAKDSSQHPGFKILFPNELELRPPQIKSNGDKKSSLTEADIDWVNASLNEEQRRAILMVLEGVYRPIPYVIYGPPGTGKTVTVVEAILQIFLRCPRSRILVSTPSNSSADLIACRLVASGKMNPGDMVRLNAFSRSIDIMPESIQPYSMSCEDMQSAIRHRIVITTCTTAGKVYTMCLEIGHFTHLFIDEAGQATEPESLVPIGLIRCDSNPGQIVLAGDPKQLGPVLMSSHASAYGLGLSLLERLTESRLYARNESFAAYGHYDPKLITKLIRNYRSHSALLSLPSFMFYDNELVSCAPPLVAQKLAHFNWLPTEGLPLLFHGIRGENFQEPDSPSWCNPAEVYHVARYLQLLLNAKIDPEEIGVITPYKKQVDKIREFIKASDLFPVKVGSVEEFQGQERDVIIVSTVRSHESYENDSVIQHLGFLRNPKRFNVTVTRARSLMIVIGNPHLLIHDEHWGPFLKHCVQLGGYTGCDLPETL